MLRDLNPWWAHPRSVQPRPPKYRRPAVLELRRRLRPPRGLVEVVRGPRQVGKTTGIQQIVEDLIADGTPTADLLFVRFDLELLREEPAALRHILAWYEREVRRRPLRRGAPAYVFLDEVHKLRRWHEEVKHIGDTFPVRLLLTGSSSVLVARGGRESLAGRVFTTELPAFSFREVLECWWPRLARPLPAPLRFEAAFDAAALARVNEQLDALKPRTRLALRRVLARYYQRGGYPRLYGGQVDDERWADYLTQTVFENVLGADIPDLFPVESPGLLRHLCLSIARLTGQIVPQTRLAEAASAAGIPANQPTVGRYLQYLADALLIREFRRYPLAKKASARVPAKFTVSDLGVRNAVFRGTPSLWTSDPAKVGPLVETLVQAVIRDHNLSVHFYRDYENPDDRRTRIHEVDFVAERLDGRVLPVEVKFRRKIDPPDADGVRHFLAKYDAPLGVVVTRDLSRLDRDRRILYMPLMNFLLAF